MSTDNLSAVLHGINDIRMEQWPVPVANPNQLLIRVHTVGICGSDVHYVTAGHIGPFVVKEPMILGHESSGVVLGVGSAVKGFSVGDRIAMEPGVSCMHCKHCKTGRYNLCPDMEFFATPPVHGTLTRIIAHGASFCYKLPDHVSMEEGALLNHLM
uniref:Sorbitol dehydrogenase n=1 Tax=Ditylenchus dipsaci TaxID=166011 RepID=A0A915DI02_9BILA